MYIDDLKTVVVFLVIGILGILLLIILAVIMHRGHKRLGQMDDQKRKEALTKDQIDQLESIAVEMVEELKAMFKKGEISEPVYSNELAKVYDMLGKHGINHSFLLDQSPERKHADPDEIMIKASMLNDKGELSKVDFEKYVNEVLDNRKNEKSG